MTDDARPAPEPQEPPVAGPAGAQRWADYLDWLRENAIEAVLGLPADERTASRLPSGWSPVELLSHLLHMEQRWFVWGFLAEQVPAPWGDWNVADPAVDVGVTPVWQVAEGVAAEEIAASLRVVGRRTREILDAHDLAESARLGGRFAQDPPTLEWICFHVLAEYARHAGQLDVVLELGAAARS